jgi:hypothetical protein
LEKWIVMLWTEFKWLKMSPDIWFCDHGDEQHEIWHSHSGKY